MTPKITMKPLRLYGDHEAIYAYRYLCIRAGVESLTTPVQIPAARRLKIEKHIDGLVALVARSES